MEAIAAGADLTGGIVTIPVRSSWDELRDAQAAWDRELSDLLARGEAVTAPDPRSNAVEVRLGSQVPSARREALERDGPGNDVAVKLVPAGRPRFGATDAAEQCGKFKEDKAFCDPTIVAGVTIQNEAASRLCTAGPTVIEKKPATNTTTTFLLTAGHCIENAEVGKSIWKSSDKAENALEIGKSLVTMTPEAGDTVDVGLIAVEKPAWQKAGQVPVEPAVAYWKEVAHEPTAVATHSNPAVGFVTCLSGQTAGTGCGKTKAIGLTTGGKGSEAKEVAEVAINGFKGDSGGPFFTAKGGLAIVEGIAKSVHPGITTFTPLEYALKRLETKGYELTLLRLGNQKRPKCPMPVAGMERCFITEASPATLKGSQVGSNVFTVNAGTIKCTTINYSGTLEEQSETIELTPSYSGCTAFGFISAPIDVNGCKFKFAATSKSEADSFGGTVDVVCPEGSAITATAFNCHVKFGSQTGLSGVTYTDTTAASPKADVDVSVNLSGIKYTQESKSFPGCSSGTFTNGTYAGSSTLWAETAEGATGIEVG
ncbi:MAG TPA: trypsin-like serine protease [Solirubrobacterales bacterium]